MSDPYFQSLFARRIGGAHYGKGTDIYKFEKIKRAKRQVLADHPERTLLDFGIGENDAMADPLVRSALHREANRLENRGYADNGCLEFKEAAARFMRRKLGVALDPLTEINHCIGSKSALAILPSVFIDPGDVTLMTVPGYPVAGTHTKYLGGTVYPLPLTAENDFYPDFGAIPAEVLEKAKILVVNYPNSPTGQVATVGFYRKVVDFAHEYKLVVVQDAAHLPFQFRGEPLSFLSVDGAKEVGVEVHSLSKGWNMIGWRIGWVCGNPLIVKAYSDVKDNTDSGQFLAIQKAAVVALDDDVILETTRRKYRRRLEKLVDTLGTLGFACKMPGGTYFLYAKAPQGVEGGPTFADAGEASRYLITEHSICTVPWDDAGAYLRFSVTYLTEDESEDAEDKLMAALAARLEGVNFVFS